MSYTFFAGYSKTNIQSNQVGVSIPLHIFYPTNTPEKMERLGPFQLDVALNSTPLAGQYPLIMFSHGSGSMPLLFRTLGQFLARKGFIVGMPEHPFNNRNDNSAVDTVGNLANRPIHLQAAIDWFFDASEFKYILIPDSVSLIGHSMGGYTVLALAGGLPAPLPQEVTEVQSIKTVKDKRIRCIVLFAPATVWFRQKDALNNVNVPILMYTAELDELAPAMPHAQIIFEGLKTTDQLTYKIIRNAGHFSFMSIYPNELKSTAVPPSQDPPGFNRQAFLDQLYPEVTEFLLRHESKEEQIAY